MKFRKRTINWSEGDKTKKTERVTEKENRKKLLQQQQEELERLQSVKKKRKKLSWRTWLNN